MAILPTTSTASTATTNTASTGTATDSQTLAGNFTTFLTLLTTQLKNQNPLDPLDTNQFTAQLVQFASVEQQMKQNDQLASLIALEKTAASTTALAYVGQNVVVDGATTALTSSGATWDFNVAKVSTASIVIKDSTGQTAYTGSFAGTPGAMAFTWDGRGNDGKAWPAGNYTMAATAVDTSGQSVGISTEVTAVVDSVDLTKDPATLSINGTDYTMDKVKRIVRQSYTTPTTPTTGT